MSSLTGLYSFQGNIQNTGLTIGCENGKARQPVGKLDRRLEDISLSGCIALAMNSNISPTANTLGPYVLTHTVWTLVKTGVFGK